MFILTDIKRYLYLINFKYKHKKTKVFCSYFNNVTKGFYSQRGQDAIVYSEFFLLINHKNFPKIIVDIGCNHPIKFNNSYFFEKNLGFLCIAVDPIKNYVKDWAKMRPKAILHNVALGFRKGNLSLMTSDNLDGHQSSSYADDMLSTLLIDKKKFKSGNWKIEKVAVLKTQTLFNTAKLSEIGIMSIDVEGFEMEVIKGIDFSKTRIHIMIIENNTNGKFGSDEIRKIMNRHGFIFYARIWALDDIFLNKNDLEYIYPSQY